MFSPVIGQIMTVGPADEELIAADQGLEKLNPVFIFGLKVTTLLLFRKAI